MLVERLFVAVLRGCLRFVIEVFPDHTHLLFLMPVADSVEDYMNWQLVASTGLHCSRMFKAILTPVANSVDTAYSSVYVTSFIQETAGEVLISGV